MILSTLKRGLALHLSPDLHAISRRLKEDQAAVQVVRTRLEDLRDQPHSAPISRAMLDEAVEDLVEVQARLIETVADLTGRRPDVLLKGG